MSGMEKSTWGEGEGEGEGGVEGGVEGAGEGADVGDGEEHHRQPLEAETERPAWSGLGLVLGLG